MNIKFLPLISILTLLNACAPKENQDANSKIEDFDIFCDHFTKLVQIEEFSDLSPVERSKILEHSLSKEFSASSEVYLAWSAIRNATPSQRPSLYKNAATSAGDANWECSVIDDFGSQVGSN